MRVKGNNLARNGNDREYSTKLGCGNKRQKIINREKTISLVVNRTEPKTKLTKLPEVNITK